MACTISDETYNTIKQLIKQITNKQENSSQFNNMEKHVVNQIRNSSSMYFSNKKQIDDNIYSMCDKFILHGFPLQAEHLKKIYHQYISDNLAYSELMHRLNVVKFLLCMSNSPTTKFLRHPERYCTENVDEVEEIDWKTYLLEDCEKYHLNFDEDSSTESELSSDGEEDECQRSDIDEDELIVQEIELINAEEAASVNDLREMKENLFFNIHQLWYNQINTIIEADSRWFEANVAVLWEQHLNEQVGGLIPLNNLIILPEYNVIREIFWQLYKPHNSIVFEINVNKLQPKSNITVPSVRTIAFQSFVMKFVSYIELMEFFRSFIDTLDDNTVCETYRSYGKSVKSIFTPIYNQVIELEKIVQRQETTFTLLQLYRHFEELFEPLIVLKKIHNEIILDSKRNSAVECSSRLLARLYNGLNSSFNKLEQDLKLTLFLDSVYYYFMIIDSWLMNDDLSDKYNEFVIKENYDVQPNLSSFCKNNALINIITEQILQIGKNINLLRLLGQYNLINDNNETIHEEFVRKCLIELNKFNTNATISDEKPFTISKETLQTHELTKFVDDCLLLADFIENFQPQITIEEETLFHKISKTTTSLIPIQLILDRILNGILKERFTVSSLMVKTVLIEQYKLDLEFQFLRHLYLFHDDVIFTFYIRFFEKMESGCKNWCNKIWLTTHLQDIIMDLYPDFYENCSVDIKENWIVCVDGLNACNLINLHHNLQWPLNIIITEAQMHIYKNIFQFILKLKWALYTINRLNFSDINPEKSQLKMCHKNYQNKLAVKKLIYLRFSLINLLNSVQHYVFGYIFATNLLKFELDFEKSSDLVSIQRTHEEFIWSIYKQVKGIRDCGVEMNGCNAIFECVKNLNRMWNNKRFLSLPKVDECFKMYSKAYKDASDVINCS